MSYKEKLNFRDVYLVSMGLVGGTENPIRVFETLEGAKQFVKESFEDDIKTLKEFESEGTLKGLKIGNSYHIEVFELLQEGTKDD